MKLPLRFSLRMLFVAVTLICLLIGWATASIKWIRDRHAADVETGFPSFRSFIAHETLHRRSAERLPWALRLLGEQPVPLIHCGPPSIVKADELQRLFPEADIVEITYPSVPEQ
jgi:hypothetical protein